MGSMSRARDWYHLVVRWAALQNLFVFYYVPTAREGLQSIIPNWAAPVPGTMYILHEPRR
jgi:hypothetical protein